MGRYEELFGKIEIIRYNNKISKGKLYKGKKYE